MDIREIDLNLLPVLDALLRRRSVTQAAADLDMSQPAMSAALSRLRVLLGDALFVRTGRGLRPTDRAQALSQPLSEILDKLREEVLQAATFDPAQARREFRVVHSDVGAYVMWPRIIQAVRQDAPGVTMALRLLAQDQIGPALAEGLVDLAIGSFPRLPQSLFQQRLFDRHHVALVRCGHPLAGRKAISLKDFAQVPHAVVRTGSGIQEHIDAVLARQRLARLDCVEVPSYLMLPPLLQSGDFLAVCPGQLADAFDRQGRFEILKLPMKVPESTIRMHWHRRSQDDGGHRWLRSLIARTLSLVKDDGAKARSP